MAVPAYKLAPLEYRVGLDAACIWLAQYPPVQLHCEQPALLGEVVQRMHPTNEPPWSSGLWIEPQLPSWQKILEELAQRLPPGGRLAVLLSMPPARNLPERREWTGAPLGEQPGGLSRLLQGLPSHGFTTDTLQGLHSGQAVLLNAAALWARKAGRLAWADRLEFTARKRYIQPLSKAWRATCALILAERT